MTTCVGVDIGGTKIAASVVDGRGTVLRRARRETPAQDPDQIARAVAEVVGELVGAVGDGEGVAAVGVACAGLIDRAGETVVFAPNLAWRDEPLKARLESLVGLPIVLENDANAAAWGEFRFGAARDVDDMVLITLGTGVGGGIIDDSQLLRGAHGMGAEVGHLRVVPDGHRCGCGNKGCWEMYASGSALVREARALVAGGSPHAGALADRCGGDPGRLDGRMVTEVAGTGDPAATELLEDIGRWVGEGCASLAAVLDPALFVIGGGVSAAGDLVLSPARSAFARHLTGRGHRETTPMTLALLGNDAGMIGAADLAARAHG
ncbi:ROK family glucokinase [Ornithinimicrobium pekingense]|uniref:Glucokinase n=1 Tax=Ornithinimicrobium pekingense TaxID=384677 RepID=A0ABQ2FBE9_9MICO|nr:ROK family glucokinase [Ornithinimicrobium pekingense]GGK69383.1 glucokinase [Ornithinimicrobium pekingense]